MTTTVPTIEEAFKLTPTSVKCLITDLYKTADQNDVASKQLSVEPRYKGGLAWYDKQFIAEQLSLILHQDRRVRNVKVHFPYMLLKKVNYVTIVVTLSHHSR